MSNITQYRQSLLGVEPTFSVLVPRFGWRRQFVACIRGGGLAIGCQHCFVQLLGHEMHARVLQQVGIGFGQIKVSFRCASATRKVLLSKLRPAGALKKLLTTSRHVVHNGHCIQNIQGIQISRVNTCRLLVIGLRWTASGILELVIVRACASSNSLFATIPTITGNGRHDGHALVIVVQLLLGIAI